MELAQRLIDYCARRGRSGELADVILQARFHLRQWAVAYQEQSQEEQIEQAVAYLQAQVHSLVVLDNLETMPLLEQPIYRDLIPADLPCHLLFTSRQSYTGQWHSLNLNVLMEAAALELLLGDPRRRPVLTQPGSAEHEAARSICAILGRLPLALEKAAVHLQNHFPILIAHYRDELFKRGALPVLDDPRGGKVVTLDERHRAGLIATLQSQWEGLTETAAKEVLQVAGQLPEAAVIPIARLGLLAGLLHTGQSFFDMTIGQAVQQLLDASLMEPLQEGQVRLHPLVREFAQRQTHDPDQFRRLCAGRLLDAYEDFAILENQCIRRGIISLQKDILIALDLMSSQTDSHPSITTLQSPLSNLHPPLSNNLHSLLRLIQLEAHSLITWNPSRQPTFFAQQLYKRTQELTLNSLWSFANKLLRKKTLPYFKLLWVNKKESLALERTFTDHTMGVTAIAVTSDGQKAVSTSYDGILKVWNPQTGVVELTLKGHTVQVYAVAITPDGQKAVSASLEHTLKVWNLQTGMVEQTLTGHEGAIRSVAITPDGQKVISASNDGTLKVWNLQTGMVEQTLTGHEGAVNSLTITHSGQKVISASDDRTLKVWNLQTGLAEQTMKGHTSWVHSVGITPNDQKAISGSSDKTLKVWNLQTGQVEQTLYGHVMSVLALAITRDGQKAISASDDKTLKVWNLSAVFNVNPEIVLENQIFTGHTEHILTISITPDSQKAISASWDKTLKLWNLKSGQVEKTFYHTSSVDVVAITPDGRKAVATDHETMKVWNLQTGLVEQILVGHTENVLAITTTSDSKEAISASCDDTLKVWNLQTGLAELTLCGHLQVVRVVAVTPDSKKAISASDDNTIKVWNLETGLLELNLIGDTKSIYAIATTPDSQKAISVSSNSTLKLWNLITGQEITSITLDGFLRRVAVALDGVTVAAGDTGGNVYCLRLVLGEDDNE